jgi:hypothetical protein
MTKKLDNLPLLLVKHKDEFKAEIERYIREGDTLANKAVTTAQEKDQLLAEFKRWDNRNYEAICTAFNVRRHTHEYNYQYHEPVDILGALRGDMHQPETLEKQISEVKGAITFQLEKLRGFHDMIDLQQVDPMLKRKAAPAAESDVKKLLHLLSRFHNVVRKLRERHGGRDPFLINDEYDVQDMLFALLQIDFEDVRKEDFSPSHIGANTRIDFVLKLFNILLEVKMTRKGLTDKELGEQLAVDVLRYKEHPNAKHLVIFIYDRGDHVVNKEGLIRDFSTHSTTDFTIDVVINPM